MSKCEHKHTENFKDTSIAFGAVMNLRTIYNVKRCKDCGKIVSKTALRTVREPSEWGKKLLGTFSRHYKLNSKGERTDYYKIEHHAFRPVESCNVVDFLNERKQYR